MAAENGSSKRQPSARASSRCRWRTSGAWPVARRCRARSSAVCAPDTGTSARPFVRRSTCDDQSRGRGSGSHRVLRHDGADPEPGRGARDIPAPFCPGFCVLCRRCVLASRERRASRGRRSPDGRPHREARAAARRPNPLHRHLPYVWDARVAHAGISPYAYPPSARELEPLRDLAVFPHLNHPTWRTIYPPAAQTFFRLVYAVRSDSVSAMKLAVGLAELIGLATVVGLLRAGGRPLSNAVIYAWNPLVLIEVWGMGHLDGLVVPAVAGAVWMALRGRMRSRSAPRRGSAAQTVPGGLTGTPPDSGLARCRDGLCRGDPRGLRPRLLAGTEVLGSLPRYLTEEYFNPGLLRSVVDAPHLAVVAGSVWILAVGAWRRDAVMPSRAIPLIGGLLLLSPNLFPWYVIWLVPFLAWSPLGPLDCLHRLSRPRLQLLPSAAVGDSQLGSCPRVRAIGARGAVAPRHPAPRLPLAGALHMTAVPLPLRPPLPRSLYLETTSRCNSLCETCILTFGGREPQRDLSWGGVPSGRRSVFPPSTGPCSTASASRSSTATCPGWSPISKRATRTSCSTPTPSPYRRRQLEP